MAPVNTYGLIQQALERARTGRAPVLGFQPPRPSPGLGRLQLPSAAPRPPSRFSGLALPNREIAAAPVPWMDEEWTAPAVGPQAGGAMRTATNIIGAPRAALTSTLKETIDLGQDIIGLFRNRGWGGESSPNEWWQQASSNYGFGDLINEERNAMGWGLAAVSPFLGPLGVGTATMGAAILADNIWADRVIGLIGDVALDPLTYMGGLNIYARALGGAKKAAIALHGLKATSKADLAVLANQVGARGVKVGAMRSAIDDAIRMSDQGRSVSSMSRTLRQTKAGEAVAEMMGMTPGLRLRVPGTGAVGRTFARTPLGRATGTLYDKVPQGRFLKEWMLNTRVANIPVGMRFGLGDDAIKTAIPRIRADRAAARKAVRADKVPLWKRPAEVGRRTDLAGRAAVQGMDKRLAQVAGRAARGHVEVAVPRITPFGAAGTQLAGALGKIKRAEPVRGPLMAGRMFGRADLPMTVWRNMPFTGTIMPKALKKGADGVRMFSRFGDDFSERLQNVLKPEAWNKLYAENPGLANEIQGGLTKVWRQNMSVSDEIFRELLDSGDPDQIVRAWSAEQSMRYARGQRAFFREVNRKMRSDLYNRAKDGSLPQDAQGEWLLGRWLRAAVNGDALVVDELGRVTGVNRNSRWWKNLPEEIRDVPEPELIGYAQAVRNGFNDLDKTVRRAFGDLDPTTGEYLWADELGLLGDEGLGYFPRRLTERMRELFGFDFTESAERGGRGSFEGGYRTAQSMRNRLWKPGHGGIKLTDEAKSAVHKDYLFNERGNWYLGDGQGGKFKIVDPQKAGLSVQDQIDRVATAAFGEPMYEQNVFKVLDSYMGGMSLNVATESMMSHMKHTMGFDDMFRLPDDVVAQFKRVANKGLQEWDATSGKMRKLLGAKLDVIRSRTRRLYAVSQADFEEVIDTNYLLAEQHRLTIIAGRARGGTPAQELDEGTLRALRLWEAVNENTVRLFGEMEGIAEEMTQAGARLNEIYEKNQGAILSGTYKYRRLDDVQDLVVRIHDRAARVAEIQDDMIVMNTIYEEALTTIEAAHSATASTLHDTEYVIWRGVFEPLDEIMQPLREAFTEMAHGIKQSAAYIKGDNVVHPYIGQFPLAVQQAKLLLAGDESITQLIRLAETLDPGRAAQMADEALAAGTPAAAARMPGKWAKIRAKALGDQHWETIPSGEGDINIGLSWTRPSAEYPHARTVDIQWSTRGRAPEPGTSTGAQRGGFALPGLKRLDQIVKELSDEGFVITAIAEGDLLARYRRYGFVDNPGVSGVATGYTPIIKYPARELQRATPYKTWADAYNAAIFADEAVGHQEFISWGVTGHFGTPYEGLLRDVDDGITRLAETVRFDETLQSIRQTTVGGRKGVPKRTVEVPEPLVRPGEAPSVGERIQPGRPIAEFEDITTADVLTAATVARDEANVLFADAQVIRKRLAVLEERLAADKAAGAPTRGTLLQQEVTLLEKEATVAELFAQSRARDAADLLDMTRVERAGEAFEEFFSRPWDKRDPKQIETFIDAVEDGLANFGPWRIASGNTDLDSNMVLAAQAFQRLTSLRDVSHPFWKKWDTLQNWFKAGLIATPGFVYRNMFGAFLNAYLDGVNVGAIIRSANTVSRINKQAETQGVSFMQAARGMADEDAYMKDFVTLLEQGVRGGGQATRSVDPYAPAGLGRWGQGITRGSAQAPDAPSGLRGPLRLVKSAADVITGRGPLRNIGTLLPFGPGSSSFVWNKAIRSANMQMEDVIRLGVGMDTLRWGGTPQDALERIARSQFDYGELTSFEQTWMRRFVPFYTWTRKNVPYQFNKLATNPAAYNRVMSVKRNMELGTEDEGVVPDWFLEPFGIRMPWKWGGARVYGVPDVPFLDLFRYDPTQTMAGHGGMLPYGLTELKDNLLWQMSPIVKLPLEAIFGESLRGGFNFSGKYQTMPLVFREMAGAPVLRGLANVVPGIRKKDGEWQIRDYMLYFLTNALPALSLSRRLLPSEERYQQRFVETIFSTMFGLGVQRQTPEVEEAWQDRLDYQLNQLEYRQRRDDGYSPSSGGGGFRPDPSREAFIG